jgi:hypothetical protein
MHRENFHHVVSASSETHGRPQKNAPYKTEHRDFIGPDKAAGQKVSRGNLEQDTSDEGKKEQATSDKVNPLDNRVEFVKHIGLPDFVAAVRIIVDRRNKRSFQCTNGV